MASLQCPTARGYRELHGVGRFGSSASFAALQCNNTSCRVVIGGVIDNNERVLVHWPKYVPAKEFPDAPTHIGEAATEAHTVHGHGAHRAAAVLARAVIEAAAKDKGITTGRIKEKIEAMHQAGLIRDYIRDAADEVRHFANEMAHGDFADPVDEGEAALIMKLMDRVLDEVYEGPAQVENRKDARLAKKAAAGPVPGQATP